MANFTDETVDMFNLLFGDFNAKAKNILFDDFSVFNDDIDWVKDNYEKSEDEAVDIVANLHKFPAQLLGSKNSAVAEEDAVDFLMKEHNFSLRDAMDIVKKVVLRDE